MFVLLTFHDQARPLDRFARCQLNPYYRKLNVKVLPFLFPEAVPD